MGGWNKDIKNSTGSGFKGKHHNPETIEKLRNRSKEIYKKPQASIYLGQELCDYGCGQKANYQFKKGKLCCSSSHNSCPKKKLSFSNLDHSERTAKSLRTRIETGITKTSRVKALKTMKDNNTYQIIAEKNKLAWERQPWNNHAPRGEWIMYKNTGIPYQGSFEYSFLESLESKNGIDWVINHVKRGPSIWYKDPKSLEKRLYISDYIIDNTIYEIKSSYTWNRKGKDLELENLNKAKLLECLALGYKVVLVLDKQEKEYASTLDGIV